MISYAPNRNNISEKTESKITVIDLFSGAGGFSLAAINCNLNLLGAVEFDSMACRSYEENIIKGYSPHTKLLNENIFSVKIAEFREKLELQRGELDILLGGPPCQGFSTHRINDTGIEDPRNKLLLRYFDFVKEFQPKVFLVENVPGLLWPRHADYLKKFSDLARRHGYHLATPEKLNAKNYGVPQNRERVFLLGVSTKLKRKHLTWPPKPTHFAPNSGSPTWKNAASVFPKPPESVLRQLEKAIGAASVAELEFGDEFASEISDNSDLFMQHSAPLVQRFEATPINGSRHDIEFRLPCHSEHYDGHKDVYGRIKLAQPGPTITTGCYNPSKGRFLHPWLPHGIAVRYAARLQTFPDSFAFAGGVTSQSKQIGNAVPIKLGEVLIGSVKEFLSKQDMI